MNKSYIMASSCIMCGKCSSSTIHVLPVLKRLIYDAFERELVDKRVPRRTQPGCSIIICKCCFTSLDRCSKRKGGARHDRKRHRSSDKCRDASRIYSYNIPTYSLQAVGRGHLHS